MAEVLSDTTPGIPKVLFWTGMGGAATRGGSWTRWSRRERR